MNRTLSHARRVTALLLAVLLLVPLAACAKQDEVFVPPYRDFQAPPVAERTFYPTSAYPDEGSLGDYYVKIKEARQCEVLYVENLPAKKAELVTIDFTNYSRSPICFEDALFDSAFQNGEQAMSNAVEGFINIDTTIVLDRTYDLTLARQEVQPGETLEVCRLYAASEENPLEVFISEDSLFDEEKIAKTFVINKAYPEAEPYDAEPNLGDYYVDINTLLFDAYRNNAGEDVFSIPLTFVNFSSIPIAFSDVMEIHAYQGKEELLFFDNLSSYYGINFYIKNSGHGFFIVYFRLCNNTDPVTITVSLKGDPSISLSETVKNLNP